MLLETYKKHYLSDLDNIQHWSERNRLKDESISSHTYKVVVYTRMLIESVFSNLPIEIKQSISFKDFQISCLTLATFHDWDEVFIKRDLSHVVKYNEFNGHKIREVFKEFVEYKLSTEIPPINPVNKMVNQSIQGPYPTGVKELVKVADVLSMIHYCTMEIEMGNKSFFDKFENTVQLFEKSVDIMVDILQPLADGYELYLDDINECFTHFKKRILFEKTLTL